MTDPLTARLRADASPAALLTADWVIALDDPEMARRIVAAARGETAGA